MLKKKPLNSDQLLEQIQYDPEFRGAVRKALEVFDKAEKAAFRAIQPSTLLTSHEVGLLLQMDPSSVVKWVNEGKMPAYRTPGGHRRIRAIDLLPFLEEYHMAIPEELMHLKLIKPLVPREPKPFGKKKVHAS